MAFGDWFKGKKQPVELSDDEKLEKIEQQIDDLKKQAQEIRSRMGKAAMSGIVAADPSVSKKAETGRERRGFKGWIAAGLAATALAGVIGGGFWAKAGGDSKHKMDAEAIDALNNMPAAVQTIDNRTTFDANVADLGQLAEQNSTKRGYLEDRDQNPGGDWFNPFDDFNQVSAMEVLNPVNDQTENIKTELRQEEDNKSISDEASKLGTKYDEAIANGQQAGATDDILNQLSTLSERNSSNLDDDAKDFLQSKIDALSLKITSEKYGVTIDQYNQYKKASEATGLSIEKIDEYSKYYGVDANNFGTKAAFEQMHDQAKGQRVSEEMKADSPKEAKEELLFIAYNNPASLAQYANALNEDTKTDSGVEGFKTPEDVTELYKQYVNEDGSYTEKFYADFAEFKEALSNATVTERAATSRDSLSYMYDNDDVSVVNVKENSGGDNKKIYIIKMVNKDGVEVIINLKDVCAQLSIQKPAPKVVKAKTQVLKYKVTHGKVERIPSNPKTPSTPATPTPDNPVTPPVTPDAKVQAQNIIQTNTDKTADSGSSNATTSGEVDTTTNAGNADKGTDDNRTGTEYQPGEPIFDENA